MEDGSAFCGSCGARLPSHPQVIDGKKRKRTRRFIYHSARTKGRTIVFLTGFAVLLILSLWILIDTIPQLNGIFSEIGQAFRQISLKSKYLAEGVPLHYISQNISDLASCITVLVDLVFSSFLILFSGYFTYFFAHNLFLHLKFKGFYSYHKPVALQKISNVILVLGTVILIVFLICYLALWLIQTIC